MYRLTLSHPVCVIGCSVCVCMCGCTSVNPRPTFGSIMGSRLRRVDILFEEKYKAPLRQCVPPAPPSAQNRDIHAEKRELRSRSNLWKYLWVLSRAVMNWNYEILAVWGLWYCLRTKVFSYSGNSGPIDWEQRVTRVNLCYICLKWF